uniref:rRNA methyltransferase 2, mitochondrial n=2 Tax=Parascaris univalens TaxID=6257 RepID=A0A915AQ53_PARUN
MQSSTMDFLRCFSLAKRSNVLLRVNQYVRNFANNTRTAKKRTITSKYIRRQLRDEFVLKAREHSYRARSAFKLIEINNRYRFINPGAVVVDVGSAPGSWCQVIGELVHKEHHKDAYVLGIDLQPMVPITGVDLITMADITSPETHRQIKQYLNGRSVDAVVSDMAPNPSGDKTVDHERIIALCEQLLSFCCGNAAVIPLKKGGTFLCKIWDGQRRVQLIESLKEYFHIVHNIKPDASRDHSAELYLLAMKRK